MPTPTGFRVNPQSTTGRQAVPPVSIRIPPALLDFVDREAARTFRTRNAYIRELLVREYERSQANAG